VTTVFWGAAYFAAINLITFFAFGWDKSQARKDGQRISESALLNLSFFGGSVGAKIAQRRFWHKTGKQPFAFQLNVIVGVQAVAICVATVWWLTGAVAN